MSADASVLAAQVAVMHAAQHLLMAEEIVRATLVDLPQAVDLEVGAEQAHSLGEALRLALEPLTEEGFPYLIEELLKAGRALYPDQLASPVHEMQPGSDLDPEPEGQGGCL